MSAKKKKKKEESQSPRQRLGDGSYGGESRDVPVPWTGKLQAVEGTVGRVLGQTPPHTVHFPQWSDQLLENYPTAPAWPQALDAGG